MPAAPGGRCYRRPRIGETGYFYEPTVLAGSGRRSDHARGALWAVAIVNSVDSLDTAIEWANAVPFALPPTASPTGPTTWTDGRPG
ncbi:MAG: hypothetical protein Ct9H300mP12_09530 [Acidimicrobiales bacterium]|nr:MAG: hypothetical protein Ct9H300mP12_09530 [Acidimicrobiales bacterium]